MPSILYEGRFGEKKRIAVSDFVRKVDREVSLSDKLRATSATDGQVVIVCGIDGSTNKDERCARHVMAKASQEVLSKHGVWVVGIPEPKK
jgi:hypothetical protein